LTSKLPSIVFYTIIIIFYDILWYSMIFNCISCWIFIPLQTLPVCACTIEVEAVNLGSA
jgi:hypothetical protein